MAFTRVLIANRGEIACRIISTAHEMGYETVSIYSEVDANAPHVEMADFATCVGPAPVAASYLHTAEILLAAKRTNADAIHPGYGFLAENAQFAVACAKEGLIFIGPSPQAIELMGNKRLAKLRMVDAGVPCLPGYNGMSQDDDILISEGIKIGFPLMIKAAAGGGGRGMRLVQDDKGLAAAITAARSEAENAFGSTELILEKAVVDSRHIEVQIFADNHGNCIHLGERDCSIQRRHQKIIEEAPSPVVNEILRAKMGATAVAVAQAVDYVGAGTVEFLLDAGGDYYFLEMNTRLQVEHPVTEMVTGLDLVAWQLSVASGAPLPLRQDEISFQGHSIEVRLYAEDPYEDFLPQTGRVVAWQPSSQVRVDSGIAEGQEITPFYDSMVAKVISHGSTREDARRRLLRGLDGTVLLGIPNNRNFLSDILRHQSFISGAATTTFIGENFSSPERPIAGPLIISLAAVLLYRTSVLGNSGWQSASPASSLLDLRWGDQQSACRVVASHNDFEVELPDSRRTSLKVISDKDGHLRYCHKGVATTAIYAFSGNALYLDIFGGSYKFTEFAPELGAAGDQVSDDRLLAPMAGRIVAICANAGETVTKGQVLLVLEAMKMEHEIKAFADCVIENVAVTINDQVLSKQLLVVVATTHSEPA